MNNFYDLVPLFREKYFIRLNYLCEINLTGSDAQVFLQNQTTNNINLLKDNNFQTNTLLSPKGLVESFFLIFKVENSFIILVDKNLRDRTLLRLNKYLISEDVEINDLGYDHNYCFFSGPRAIDFLAQERRGVYLGDSGFIKNSSTHFDFKELKLAELMPLKILSGYPLWNVDIDSAELFNNSSLLHYAYDKSKGCFPGNETISKIESRKGAGFKDCVLVSSGDNQLSKGDKLKVNSKTIGTIQYSYKMGDKLFYIADLIREYRLDGKKIITDSETILTVYNLPVFDYRSKALMIYDNAIDAFQANNDKLALELFDLAIAYDPFLSDAYESKAVLLGRLERFEEAIHTLHELCEIDPKSVLAHTNLSMFYMKVGEIEKAEEHKGIATFKSFESFGDEAKRKKELEQKEMQEREEALRKHKMFEQVLEIDPDDPLANYGLSEFYYNEKDFKRALSHIEIVISSDPKYSVGYLLKGKIHLALNEKKEAMSTFGVGVEVAAKNGDLMPANEMQRFLNKG